MSLLVYHKNEAETDVITSFTEEKDTDFEYSTLNSSLHPKYIEELNRRVAEIKENPEIGIPFEEVCDKIRTKYLI